MWTPTDLAALADGTIVGIVLISAIGLALETTRLVAANSVYGNWSWLK